MGPVRIVLTTHPARGAAPFARALVERRLAACVQMVPVSSVYRWRGRVERAREVQLVAKTTAVRLPALEQYVRAEHPYDTPEFVVLAGRAADRYGAWVASETRARGGR